MAQATAPQFASLYVGDLHANTTEALLYETFNSIGPVASIRVCRDSATRKSLGYAYVNLHSVADAERALDTLNYARIGPEQRSMRIMWSHRDPSLRKTGTGNVFVKNLDKKIDNKGLYDTFSLFGNILSCKVAADPKTEQNLGYDFVHYETEDAARKAIEKVNGMLIGEKMVFVGAFIKRNEREKPEVTNFTNIYVKNIPNGWDDEKFRAEFAKHGEITSHCITADKKGRRFGFVNYKESEPAKLAIKEFHCKELNDESSTAASSDNGEDVAKSTDPDGHPDNQMYCVRAMSKRERMKVLAEKFKNTETQTRKESVNLYVKNLADNSTDQSLEKLFSKFGQITSAKVMKDDKGRSKGFGFVCFKTPEEATKAVTEMHLRSIRGKPLYVGLAEKKEARVARLTQRYNSGGKGKGLWVMKGMNFQQQQQWGQQQMGGVQQMGGQQQQFYVGKGPMFVRPQQFVRPAMPFPNQMQPIVLNPGMIQKGKGKHVKQGELTASALAAAPPTMQKQMLGERLYPAVSKYQPDLAGKITGMLLEMDNSELLILLESEQQMRQKIEEALRVLRQQT